METKTHRHYYRSEHPSNLEKFRVVGYPYYNVCSTFNSPTHSILNVYKKFVNCHWSIMLSTYLSGFYGCNGRDIWAVNNKSIIRHSD
jgi:hypothetical protein